MKFTLTIDLGNEASQPQDIPGMLREVTETIQDMIDEDLISSSGGILDVNGNTVGSWKFKED